MTARLAPYSAWIWLSLAVILLGVVRAVASGAATPAPLLATSNSSSTGGLALERYVRALGHVVRVTTSRSAAPCAGGAPRSLALVLGMAGADIPDAQLTDCLAALRGGATLLLLSDGSTGAPLLERLGIQIAPVGAEGVAVVEPLLLRPPVAQVDATAASEISAAPPGAVALSGASGAVLERFAVGRGALWVDTAPAMFSNASLSSADNARAMANLLPPHAHVWFEEYVGGSTAIASAKANWLSDSVWGVAAIFAFFVLLAYRGLTGVRLGPPSTPLRETRRPATEFVTSMAGTLRDARAGDDLLRFYRRRLERAVRERNIDAHPSDAARELSAEVHAVLDGAAPVSESELLARVRAIADYQDRLEKTSV